jgi:hypothetical protein
MGRPNGKQRWEGQREQLSEEESSCREARARALTAEGGCMTPSLVAGADDDDDEPRWE